MMGSTLNKLTLGPKVSFTSPIAKTLDGGLAYMGGLDNEFSMDKTSSLASCTAGGNGGCFAMYGTNTNLVTIVGIPG